MREAAELRRERVLRKYTTAQDSVRKKAGVYGARNHEYRKGDLVTLTGKSVLVVDTVTERTAVLLNRLGERETSFHQPVSTDRLRPLRKNVEEYSRPDVRFAEQPPSEKRGWVKNINYFW